MSGRTVVMVEMEPAAGLRVKLQHSPLDLDPKVARSPRSFKCRSGAMPSWTENGAVRHYGQKLDKALRSHPAISEALDHASKIAPGDMRSVYFYLLADEAERLCWETLCNQQGRFLALDRRWPIGRMAASMD